jgi:hypothetical protein
MPSCITEVSTDAICEYMLCMGSLCSSEAAWDAALSMMLEEFPCDGESALEILEVLVHAVWIPSSNNPDLDRVKFSEWFDYKVDKLSLTLPRSGVKFSEF